MHARAVTLIEITVVVAISAVLAAGAFIAISSASKQKDTAGLDALLALITEQRASHVAAGRSEFLALCVDCFDDGGAPQPPQVVAAVDVALVEPAGPFDNGRMVLSQVIGGVTFRITGSGPIVLDALGRSVALQTDGSLVGVDRRIDVTLTTGKRESITLTGDGRLLSSFAPPQPVLPAHAQNLSSRRTATPMPRGAFTGDATRATAVRLE